MPRMLNKLSDYERMGIAGILINLTLKEDKYRFANGSLTPIAAGPHALWEPGHQFPGNRAVTGLSRTESRRSKPKTIPRSFPRRILRTGDRR